MKNVVRFFLSVTLSLVLVFVLNSCGKETDVTETDVTGTKDKTSVETVETVEAESKVEVVEPETVESVEIITVYAGSINQSYPIHMAIVQNGTSIIGSYYYDSRKIDIPFTGEINGNNLFITTDDGSETFDGTLSGKEISGIWTMGETVYDFELIEESKIDTSTDDHASLHEVTIVEFNLVETGERVGVYIDNNNEYIVFRLAKDGKVLVEGPSFDESSWDYFKYNKYTRGGGAENEAIEEATLTFTVDSVEYQITKTNSLVAEDIISYGFSATNGANGEKIPYKVDFNSLSGDLSYIENYEIFKPE